MHSEAAQYDDFAAVGSNKARAPTPTDDDHSEQRAFLKKARISEKAALPGEAGSRPLIGRRCARRFANPAWRPQRLRGASSRVRLAPTARRGENNYPIIFFRRTAAPASDGRLQKHDNQIVSYCWHRNATNGEGCGRIPRRRGDPGDRKLTTPAAGDRGRGRPRPHNLWLLSPGTLTSSYTQNMSCIDCHKHSVVLLACCSFLSICDLSLMVHA